MNKRFTVNLPDIGEGVVEGEVVEWLKELGDDLAQDEPVVVVMTDKATVELPAPHPGKLAKRYFDVGELALLDKPLYDIEVEGEVEGEVEESAPIEEEKPVEVVAPKKETPKVEGDKVLAAPATRQLAKQLGVNLSGCTASGLDGEVTVEDVKRVYAPTKSEAIPIHHFDDDETVPLVGVQRLMADAMERSRKEIPHFSFFERLDVEELWERKEQMKAQFAAKGVKLTLMPFYIEALSKALEKVPLANASLDRANRQVIIHKRHNIGIAMNSGHGLIVPVLKGVERMGFEELVIAFDQLKKRALASQLTSTDMKEGTISITNFGTLGGIGGTPVIPLPQTAIVGLGKIEKAAAVVDDQIAIRREQLICYSFDHRLIDGAAAATLSNAFVNKLS